MRICFSGTVRITIGTRIRVGVRWVRARVRVWVRVRTVGEKTHLSREHRQSAVARPKR